MSASDCDRVDLPTWGADIQSTYTTGANCEDKPIKIASLLLAKLGDFLVPGIIVLILLHYWKLDVVSNCKYTFCIYLITLSLFCKKNYVLI